MDYYESLEDAVEAAFEHKEEHYDDDDDLYLSVQRRVDSEDVESWAVEISGSFNCFMTHFSNDPDHFDTQENCVEVIRGSWDQEFDETDED